ncbi:hypothetical protein [Streptomyces sp. NBC_01408]|uniref:hypothetical protein n=1 Tax=Streptomyces sp. NBC_01408 TaxID=2903855 RepID=UPI002251FD64|nr:hypothetical protein [Streptomyces sp. NBC_01408]MCX4692438.1 hypothetical protein [Streptomyces sp. NBC_01408]
MEQLHPQDPHRTGPNRLLSRLGVGGTGRRAEHSRTASTVFLLAVAVVVAVAAGGSVYAVMNGSAHPAPPGGGHAPPSGTAPGTGTSSTAGPNGTPAPPPPPAALPEAYLGTWRATTGTQTWQLTLTHGVVGEPVMTLSVQSPALACAWKAPLRSAPEPVELDASTVTSGAPPTCSPGNWSRLRLLPDGTLRRELAGAPGDPLTYRKE